ncbi:MAG: protein kinase domain-containing protein, partial [Myxococcales bacterium]
MSPCFSDEQLRALADAGTTPPWAETHLGDCATCRAQLDALRRAGPVPSEDGLEEDFVPNSGKPPSETRRALTEGARVGRYELLKRIGAGGMGEVYAAFDPELDRKVALKFLRADKAFGERDEDGRNRLLREAQAMARLSHPNVVMVHDVGSADGEVFVAMEFL